MDTKIRKNILTAGLPKEKSAIVREAEMFLSLDVVPVMKKKAEKGNEDSANEERGDAQA